MITGEPETTDIQESTDVLFESRRSRWTCSVAAIAVSIHTLAWLINLAWYYYVVPRWKQELESIGYELPALATSFIMQSDVVVCYLYVLIPIAPPALVLDFLVARWISRELGARFGLLYGMCAIPLLLGIVVYGQFEFHHAREVLAGYVKLNGPASATNRAVSTP